MSARTTTVAGVPRGFFLTFEGIEGSGKSTHVDLLADALRSRGVTVRVTREPGGTPLGEALRGLLLGTDGDPPVPQAELFLLLAARAQHVARVILPALAAGEVVISDRYGEASLAYQGGGRGLGREQVEEANALATGGLRPDLILLFDLEPDEMLRRIEKRRQKAGALDRLDAESTAFFSVVRAAYRDLADADPERFRIIETHDEKPAVAAHVFDLVWPLVARRREQGALA